MNKMRFLPKITYAVGFSLAMALTLSCSDDKDEEVVIVTGYCLRSYYDYSVVPGVYNHFCEKVKARQGEEGRSCGISNSFSYSCPADYYPIKLCSFNGTCSGSFIGDRLVENESVCINLGGTVIDYNTYCVN